MKKYRIFQLLFILMLVNCHLTYGQFGNGGTLGTTSTAALTINDVLVGRGGSGVGNGCIALGTGALGTASTATANIGIGTNALGAINQGGGANIAIGANSLQFLTAPTNTQSLAANNTAVGPGSMRRTIAGAWNCAFGYEAMNSVTGADVGSNNAAFGSRSLYVLRAGGGSNTAIGFQALFALDAGYYNTALGTNALNTLTSGHDNVGIGRGVTIPVPVSNAGDNQLSIQNVIYGVNMTGVSTAGTGNVAIAATPALIAATSEFAKLHIGGSSGTSMPSLQLDYVPNNLTNSTNKYLFVDSYGVVRQDIPTAATGVNSCPNIHMVPVTTAANGNMGCSQIYDDGTSVGIGTLYNSGTPNFAYTATLTGDWSYGSTPLTPTNGTVRLAVDGVIESAAYFATSDERYKKEIKTVNHSIEIIKLLRGVTYEWNKEAFPKMNFGSGSQIGFIAQEVEKVLPQSVIKNKEGYYSMNYTSIIPILTEGIKVQQSQIETLELKIANQDAAITELRNKINQLIPGSVIVKADNFQIVPNPITGTSTVSYKIDAGVSNAVFIVYDLQGKMLRKYNVSSTAKEGQLLVSAKDFGNGMYILSLVSNGNEIQSKHFIISE